MVKKFYFFVLGCQMNVNDSQRLRFLLKKIGLKETQKQEDADLILVLLCSVRQAPVDRVWGKLKIWQSLSKKPEMILTGCATEQDKKVFAQKFDLVFPILKPKKLISFLLKEKIISETQAKKAHKIIGKKFFNIPAYSKNKQRAYIPIGTGCNNFCTYCVVPYTRGKEQYRSMAEILCEAKKAIKQGARIITLIAQNVNSYKDNDSKEKIEKDKPDFVILLEKLSQIKGSFKIEFLTSHPKDMTDELIKAIAELDKVVKWVHLPVQSGDNTILKKMNRGYTREDYINLCKKIRQKIPNVLLTTDIIVGFPQETKKEFQNTADLAKVCKFDQAFIAKYSPRPGTVAAKLKDDVPLEEKKRRFEILDRLINKKQGTKDNPWQVAQGQKRE